MPMTASTASTMIWTTAKSTEVSRPQTALPIRVGRPGAGRSRRPPRRRWSRWRPPYAVATASARPRSAVAAPGRGAAASSAARSRRRGPPRPRGRPSTRSRPSVMPGRGERRGVELAVRRRRRVDDHRVDAAEAGGPLRDREGVEERARPPRGRRRGRRTASPPPRVEDPRGDRRAAGWLGRPG